MSPNKNPLRVPHGRHFAVEPFSNVALSPVNAATRRCHPLPN